MKRTYELFSLILLMIVIFCFIGCQSNDKNHLNNKTITNKYVPKPSDSVFTMVCYPIEELKLWYDTSEFFEHHLQNFSAAKPDTFFSYHSLSHGIASANGEAFPDCLMVLGNRIDFYGSIIDSTNTIVWNGYKPIKPYRYYAGNKSFYDMNLEDSVLISSYIDVVE